MDKVYEESAEYQDIYLNEVIESNFFSNLKKQTEKSTKIIKSTKIFLSNFSDSFSKKSACLASSYLRFTLADVLNNQNFFLTEKDLDSDISIITTVSFCEIFENKILDNFDFGNLNANNSNNKSKSYGSSVNANNASIKIFEYEDEIVIDGVKEIKISDIHQFEKLIK